MAKTKRRPGGGRKPGGEFPGKSATFTTRIQPQTRRALEEAAKARPDGSISAAAEYILKTALLKPSGAPHTNAMAAAVVLLAENIERDTKKSWRKDPFTGFALCYAAEHLLLHFTPALISDGNPAAPPAVEEAAAKRPTEFAEQLRKPAGFGRIQAEFLIREIEQAASSGPMNEWTMPIFFSERREKLALIGSELADSRKGKPK
jgi:hypothetical protein